MNLPPFHARAPSFDVQAINDTIQRALSSAGLDTTTGPMRDVTETIRRALSGGDSSSPTTARTAPDATVIDVDARVVGQSDAETIAPGAGPATEVPPAGSFETHSFSNAAGSRSYKLYVPPGAPPAPRPIVVMLHGCTQSAEDFAAGTRMNRLADEHGILVVYPEQPASANSSKCWNWFKPQDQARDAGEPAIIAGIVGEVARRHGADTRRIFVAGLSAGAAMAVVMGETYPELFAGVGAHSGLPYGSAHDIPSAMMAMKGGRSGLPGLQPSPSTSDTRMKTVHPVPTIVFHGDRDHTVQQTNGTEIVRQATEAHKAHAGCETLTTSTRQLQASTGRGCSVTVLTRPDGGAVVESWRLNGAGHAWSGGDARGSYTDAKGPDASAEMLRFFLALASGRLGLRDRSTRCSRARIAGHAPSERIVEQRIGSVRFRGTVRRHPVGGIGNVSDRHGLLGHCRSQRRALAVSGLSKSSDDC